MGLLGFGSSLLSPSKFGNVSGGNYAEFEADGTLKFNGDATVWDDINIGGVTLTKAASNQPDLIAVDGTNILTYGFDGAGSGVEEVHGSFELVHGYKQGTNLQPHIHWYATTTASGNVKWQLEYWANYGTTNEVTGTLDVTAATPEVAWSQMRSNFSAEITGANLIIGTQIHFRLFRDAGDASDTYGADAAISTFGIHYEIDTLGSRQITTK